MTNWITNLKYVLTIMIVYIHIHFLAVQIPDDIVYDAIVRGLDILADSAVPAFFALSAYLFFRSYNENNIYAKFRSRIKGLLVPYLIVSAICVIYYILKDFHSGTMTYADLNFSDICIRVLEAKNNGPIWYLLTLFQFVIIAPTLYVWIKNTRALGSVTLVIVMMFLNFIYSFSYSSLIFWMPVLVTFSAVSILAPDILDRKYSYILMGGGFLILLTIIYIGRYNQYSYMYYAYRVISPFFLIPLGKSLRWKPFKFQDYAMFVFLTHVIVGNIVKIPITPVSCSIKIILTVCLSTLIAYLLKRFAPTVYSIITGAR